MKDKTQELQQNATFKIGYLTNYYRDSHQKELKKL